MPVTFLGLRTAIYPTDDLAASKAWYTDVLGFAPYFDEPFYVGFNVGGYELGLLPRGNPGDGPTAYWGVPDAAAAFDDLVAAGAAPKDPVSDVGGGILTASVIEPGGGVLGIIENPHFQLPD